MNTPEKKELNYLIDGCIRGDRKCQEKVYEMHYRKMLGVCMRYTRNTDEAKDLVQDGFIKVFTKLEKYNRSGSFEGWIRRIVVNNAIDSFRRKKNDFVLTDSEHVLDGGAEDQNMPGQEDEGFYNIKPENVLEAIQGLSPAYKAVFNLYVMENYSHKEIAEMLDISVGTSKSNLAKAKMNLKRNLENAFIKGYE